MDVEKHRLQLTSSPAYNSFLETTENCTLYIQRKYQVLFVYHVPESPSPTSPSQSHVPESVPRPRVCPTSPSLSHVSESHVPLLVTAAHLQGDVSASLCATWFVIF